MFPLPLPFGHCLPSFCLWPIKAHLGGEKAFGQVLLQASKVLLHRNFSVRTPLPSCPTKPMGLQGSGTYTGDQEL